MTTPYIGPLRPLNAGGSINYNLISANGTTYTLANNNINPGDIMIYDATQYCVKPATTATDDANVVGVAEGQNPVNSNIDNGTTQAAAGGLVLPVRPSGIAMFISTVSDSAYVHGQAVAIGADAQHITNQSVAGNIVGYIWNPQGLTMPSADGNVRVPVMFVAAYPARVQ